MVVQVNGATIMWMSRLQSLVTTSTAESELVAAAMVTEDVLWLRKLLVDLTDTPPHATVLHCDNEAAVQLVPNNTAAISGRSKHINLQFGFVRGRYFDGVMPVQHVSTEMQLADLLTKCVPRPRLNVLGIELNLIGEDERTGFRYERAE